MRHGDIWRGIDLLAQKHGLSASGLAKRAGLDPTAFNPSKRRHRDGRPRWLSTESLARVLDAVGEDLSAFAALMTGRAAAALPLVTQEALAAADDLARLGEASAAEAPRVNLLSDAAAATCFVVEMTSDAFAPIYARGDRLVLTSGTPLKAGDRVIAKRHGEALLLGAVHLQATGEVELRGLLHDGDVTSVDARKTDWIARILWASP